MSGLSHDVFLKLCKAQGRRSKAYARHLPIIRKFIIKGIWNTMKNRKLALDGLKAFSFGYRIAKSTIRSWNSNLLKNPNWLLLHKRTLKSDFQITDTEEIAIAEIIRKV